MRKVNICSLIFLCSFTFINVLIYLKTLSYKGKHLYYFLTMWSFWMHIIYLLFISFSDIYLYCFNSDKFEFINNFMRNKYCRISYPFTYMVSCLYWLLHLLGPQFLTVKGGLMPYLSHIYLHGFISLLLLLEFILNQHEYIKISKEFAIITVIYLLYCLTVTIGKYKYYTEPYTFMEKANKKQLLVSGIIFYLILFNCYQFNVWLFKIKNRKKLKNNSINFERIGIINNDEKK